MLVFLCWELCFVVVIINSQSLEDAQAGVREGFGDQMFPNMLALAKLVSDV